MDKRYQVFVSSTFTDLREERQKVIQALLEFDCIPVGMEFFPATDDTQWDVIKRVIDDCDYYLVIVAGRYGSLSKEGLSYTQKEYEYAVEKGIPVMAFLHEDPAKIQAGKSEASGESKVKLEEFRTSCRLRLCKSWTSADDLAASVVTSLNQLKKARPAVGWVRADQIADETATKEMLRLRMEIEHLQEKLNRKKTSAPPDSEILAQADDDYTMRLHYSLYGPDNAYPPSPYEFTVSWNQIFSLLGPLLINEESTIGLINHLANRASVYFKSTLSEGNKDTSLMNVGIDEEDFNTIIVQLRALGLIELSEKSTKTDSSNVYWKLTDYGDSFLTQVRAIKRKA